MNVSEFYREIEKLYPEGLSCDWDNDGVMVSCGDICEIERILVALDPTEEAVCYAAENGYDLLLTHHPLIFSKLPSVTAKNTVGRKVIFCIMNNISVISLHTRLDAGEKGVNDALAEALSLRDVEPFGDESSPSIGRIGELSEERSVCDLAHFVRDALGCPSVEVSSEDECALVKRVAVVGGAGKDFIYDAKRAGADVYVTGECSYNALLDAAEEGISVITAGHFFTENLVCERLAEIARDVSGADVFIYNSNKIKQY